MQYLQFQKGCRLYLNQHNVTTRRMHNVIKMYFIRLSRLCFFIYLFLTKDEQPLPYFKKGRQYKVQSQKMYLNDWNTHLMNQYINHSVQEAEGNITYHCDVLSASLKYSWLRQEFINLGVVYLKSWGDIFCKMFTSIPKIYPVYVSSSSHPQL